MCKTDDANEIYDKKGNIMMYATCVLTDISYLQDLNEARKNLEK